MSAERLAPCRPVQSETGDHWFWSRMGLVLIRNGYFLLPSWDRMGSMLESLNNESHSFHSCRSYRFGFRSGCVIRQLDWLGTVGPLQHRFMNVMQFLMKKVSVICQHQNTFYIRSKLIKITLKATGVITGVQCSRAEAGSNPSLHLA